MANVNDYLNWRGDIPFSELPPCEVDALVFSLLSYINFDGIVPTGGEGITVRDAIEAYVEKYPTRKDRYLGLIMIDEISDVFLRLADCPRYADVRMFDYVNEVCETCEMQFSAVSFDISDGEIFIAFRGTDDNIVGWKEDFKLSFLEVVPSHKRAVEYVKKVDGDKRGKLYFGGHSKGGHLAVWSAVHSQKRIRNRTVAVYSLDGPGFLPHVLESDNYKEMAGRITTLLPQSSLVGLLLDNDRNFKIIKSRKSGVFQHNPMYWEVLGGQFVRLPQLSAQGLKNDTVLRERLAALTLEDKERFTEVIFDVIGTTGAKTLSELNASKIKNAFAVMKAVNDLDKETREAVGLLFGTLLNLKGSKKPKPDNSKKQVNKKVPMQTEITFFPLVSDALKKYKDGKKSN